MESFDLLIVNQGISGLALACGLNDYFRIAIIENKISSHIDETEEWNVNMSLVNITSTKILQYLKVWNQNISKSSSLLHKLEIFTMNNIQKTVFNTGYLGYLELGYITDNNLIYQALVDRARQLRNIIFMDSNLPDAINYHDDAAFITVKNNYIFKAQLVIGADGINSWVKNAANISSIFMDTKYYGLTTIIYTEKNHKNTLRCIIHNDGLLVLLPLKNAHLSVVFWLLPPYTAKKYLYISTSTQSINYDLIEICNVLGHCVVCDNIKYKIFLPRIQYTHNFINHRLVLLGQAAYTICPFFFQNINVDLIDAAVLLHHLKTLKKNHKDIGLYGNLKHYGCNRKYRITKSFMNISCIHMLLRDKSYLLKCIQYFIFYFINTMPNLKVGVLHHIMGLDDMPQWLLKDRYEYK
ncbi:FAD-dependent monooxygenase [Blochmannia endosymbiont of Camponotus nipponensis]|uniref:FAD-dependent monooxygenase n=1 Tax=Blochmannia endosymbiont of Camponotus nipponensis TaxID=2681986 RepID=UPI00135C5F28|nr:FAD-dependent monooxygenase [Blochmannia endosymbiont of Camponotus nipponensis]